MWLCATQRWCLRLAAVTCAGVAVWPIGVASAQLDAVSISGSDGQGYFATVGFNQEGNQTLAGISRSPSDPKFFDYPAYVNPAVPTNIWIMSVEPYRFGLDYPDPLHPAGFETFVSVGVLQPATDAGVPGVTFIDGVTEDTDFAMFDVGMIEFDASVLTRTGLETVEATELTFVFDGSEFESTNRVEIIEGADQPPFGPEGRSNRNEAANVVMLVVDEPSVSGPGLRFNDGVLTSIELVADVTVIARGTAFPQGFELEAAGTVTFAGDQIAFDIDDQDSLPFATSVRLLLNRRGTIDAVGTFSIAPACVADLTTDGTANGVPDGEVTLSDFSFYIGSWADGATRADVTTDGTANGVPDGSVTLSDFSYYLTLWSAGCP